MLRKLASMYKISVPCGPTEDREKVFGSIINIFPDAILDMEGEIVLGTFSDLDNLKKSISDQQIRDTARQVLSHSMNSNNSLNSGTLTFHLNKQAAFASKVNFTEGNSTLGDIAVTIGCEEPEALIIELTGVSEHQKDQNNQNEKEDGQ